MMVREDFEARWAAVRALRHADPQTSDAVFAQRALRCVDLTTLTGQETAADIDAICALAVQHQVAAVCVYPRDMQRVRAALRGSKIRAASVAMGFPDARGTLEQRCEEIRRARDDGAQEIDIVVTTQHILDRTWDAFAKEVRAARAHTGDATLKVILETGALPSAAHIYQSARIALDEGADFIKTSTGKIAVGATIDAAAAMMIALDDHGDARGLKLSGGLRSMADLRPYLQMIAGHWGLDILTADRVRIGASSLLSALLEARDAEVVG